MTDWTAASTSTPWQLPVETVLLEPVDEVAQALTDAREVVTPSSPTTARGGGPLSGRSGGGWSARPGR